ncbi:MAG: glycosyl hydrolase [Candidatus Latescibacterota bacterium]
MACEGSAGPSPAALASLALRFADPRPLSRPIPFWLLNGSAPFAAGELERQLDEFHRQGVGAVCVLPMYDLAEAYLREPWWEVMGRICARAAHLGLQVWFGDECACPSGSMAMRLPQIAQFRSVGLQASRLALDPGQSLPQEDLLAAFALPGLEPIPRQAWSRPRPQAGAAEVLLVRAGSTPGRQGVPPLAQGFGRGEVNRLSAEAMRCFVQETHARYVACLPGAVGTTITGVFTDEPALFEPPGWCADFAEQFRRRKGYDPLPYLAALFAGAGPHTHRFRCDYHEVASQLYIERFFDPQRRWCEAHGLCYGGHLWQMWPWGLAAGVLWQPDPLRTLAAMTVPGVDWTAGGGRVPVSELKMAVSAAHLADRPRSLIEVYAGLGPVWTYEQLKWMWHWIACGGIDQMVLHICYCTPDEGPAAILHPPISWQTPLWRHFARFSEYVGRISELLQAGRPAAPVAVLYPTATVWAETVYPQGVWPKPPANPLPPLPGLERLRAHIEAIAAFLVEHHVDFDFVDEEALRQARVEGGELRVGTHAYRAVVLPHTTTCRPETLDRLSGFLRADGRVVSCGDLPAHACGGPAADGAFAQAAGAPTPDGLREPGGVEAADDGVRQAVEALKRDGLRQAGDDWLSLADELPRDLRVEPNADLGPEHNLYYQRRRLDGAELFLLASHAPQPEAWRVWFRATGHPERWDPLHGTRHRLPAGRRAEGGTWLELRFEPFQAYAVVFAAAPTAGLPGLPRPATPWSRLEGWWTVEFLPNVDNPYLQPHDHVFDLRARTLGPASALVPWWRLGLGGFSGSARYRGTFTAPRAPAGRRCWLDLGRVEQAAEATLNGRPLGVALWRPYRFEVTGLFASGGNVLEVVVTNGLANFLSAPRGEAPPPLTQVAVSSLWSGLLGPVSLLVEGPERAEEP